MHDGLHLEQGEIVINLFLLAPWRERFVFLARRALVRWSIPPGLAGQSGGDGWSQQDRPQQAQLLLRAELVLR
jgi:hypothetical protein